MLSAATGIEFSPEDLKEIADRIYNLEMAFNVRLGLSRKDDTLPKKFFKEPVESGPLKGKIIEKGDFDKMLDQYYEARGWDIKTGIPCKSTLEKLDLKDVAADLKKRGLLPEEKK